MQSVETNILRKIYGHGRGWAFFQKDFSPLASREAVDLALHRLEKKGTIRRVLRGLYDYPRFSELLDQQLSPDIDQVACALARKFGWHIQPSGAAALNLMGLSTQVPGRYVYLSDGPARTYEVGKTELVFENTALKEAGFKLHKSALIVQGLNMAAARPTVASLPIPGHAPVLQADLNGDRPAGVPVQTEQLDGFSAHTAPPSHTSLIHEYVQD